MKKDIHPKYNEAAKFSCECGNVVTAGSTLESYKVEICSACHPFYTGKQKLVDSAGRVEKFKARQVAAKSEKKDDKISESGSKLKKGEKYMTLEKIKSIKEKEDKKAEKRATKAATKKPAAKKKAPAGASKASSKERSGAKTKAKKPATKKAPAKKTTAKKPAAKKADKK